MSAHQGTEIPSARRRGGGRRSGDRGTDISADVVGHDWSHEGAARRLWLWSPGQGWSTGGGGRPFPSPNGGGSPLHGAEDVERGAGPRAGCMAEPTGAPGGQPRRRTTCRVGG